MVTVTPYPSLGVSAREARKAARAQKAARNPFRRFAQRFLAVIAIMFALLGMGGGTAHAWPWDVAENVTAFITNFCGPNDVRGVTNHVGPDSMLGLNHAYDENFTSDKRGTILPSTDGSGSGIGRIQAAYAGQDAVIHPSYERYGFSTLQWTNYGGGCFSVGYWFTPVANGFLNVIVHGPMIAGMGLMNLVLPAEGGSNFLYAMWSLMISPFTEAFTQIFTPIALFVAPFGILWVWMKNKGSLQAVSKAAVWILTIFGTMVWMGSNNSMIAEKVNTFIPTFAGGAAAKINDVATNDNFDAANPRDETYQALWHGISYQTWLVGEVGPQQARIDADHEKDNAMGWGPAILNGLYVGNDNEGRDVQAAINTWNSSSYAPEKDGFFSNAETKVSDWNDDKIFRDVPMLFAVGAMCNDPLTGGGDTDPEDNLWMYGGSCDTAGAGTSHMVPYFQGQMYNNQMVTVFSGAVGASAVVLAIAAVSIYLGLQMMMFFFMLLFAPVFLTISLFADEKRRRFATRYFELLVANIVKQCAAVIGVLFIAHSMSTLMYSTAVNIPWMLKPLAAMLFLLAILLFLFPLASIAKAAAKGDTSVVDKTYNAPKKAAAVAAKAAVVAGAAVATAGVAPALGGATGMLGSGKAAGLLTTAGRAAGARGGLGKVLTSAGHAVRLGNHAGVAANDALGAKKARAAGVAQMLSGQSGKEYIAGLAKKPGMVDKNGNLTKAGMAQATKDFKNEVAQGFKSKKADDLQAQHMKNFFAGYRRDAGAAAAKKAGIEMDKNGVVLDQNAAKAAGLTLDQQGRPIQYHSLDPDSPEMKAQAQQARLRADHEQARLKNQAAQQAQQANPGMGKFSPETTPVDPKTGLPKDPAMAAAVAAGVDLKPDGTVADPAAAKAAGIHVDPDGRPITAAAAKAMSEAGGSGSGNVNARADDPKAAEELTRKGFADKARDRVDGPTFSKDDNIKVATEAKADEVLAKAGMTKTDAVNDPTLLLSGTAYRNGDVTAMDPKHPATAALTDLKFAMAEGTDAQVEAAAAKAQQVIAQHGVPSQISTVASTGTTAQNFASADVVGAMPTLTNESTWQERAEGAKTMTAAAAAMPEGHAATPAVQTYVAALSNPEMEVDEVDKLKADAIVALNQADQTAVKEGANVDAPAMASVGAASGTVVTAADPTSRGGADAASEPTTVQPTLPGMETPSANVQQASGAAASAGGPAPQGNTDVYPKGLESFDTSVSNRATALGAVPMAEGEENLGYATTIGGQTYTAASAAPLEALNHHAKSVTGEASFDPQQGAFVRAADGGGYADQVRDARLAEVAQDRYGVTPMAEGDKSQGHVATIGGQTYTAADAGSLKAFQSDYQNFTVGDGASQADAVISDRQAEMSNIGAQHRVDEAAAQDVVWQENKNYESASQAATAVGVQATPDKYDPQTNTFEGQRDAERTMAAAVTPTEAPAPMAPQVEEASAAAVSSVNSIAQQHYGVTPMDEGQESMGFTTQVGKQTYTADSQEALDTFREDMANYGTPSASGDLSRTPITEGQQALTAAGDEFRAATGGAPAPFADDKGDLGYTQVASTSQGEMAQPSLFEGDSPDANKGYQQDTLPGMPQAPVITERYDQPAQNEDAFIERVADAAQRHDATPMADGQADLGYTTDIGGQTYTASSQENLDALRNEVAGFQQEASDYRPEADRGQDSQMDTFAAGAAGAAAGSALSSDRGDGQSYEQPALFDTPEDRGQAPTYDAAPMDVNGVQVTPNSSMEDLGRAAESLPEGHAARDAYDTYTSAAQGDLPQEQVEEHRQAVYDGLRADESFSSYDAPEQATDSDRGDAFVAGAAGAAAGSAFSGDRDEAQGYDQPADLGYDTDAIREDAGTWRDQSPQADAPPASFAGVGASDEQPAYDTSSFEVAQARYDDVVSDAAPTHGALPMTEGQDDLGYNEIIGSQTYTASSQEALDALRADVEDFRPQEADYGDAMIAGAGGFAAGSTLAGGGYEADDASSYPEPGYTGVGGEQDRSYDSGTDAFRPESESTFDTPAGDDYAAAGYMGIGGEDDRADEQPAYDTPAHEREEYQAQVNAAGAYDDRREADPLDGPSFAADTPAGDGFGPAEDGPSFAAMGPLVDRDGYGDEGFTRSGGIDRDGYGAERERSDAYFNEGVDRDGYGDEGMTPVGYDQMRDRDGYGAGQPGWSDTLNEEGRYRDEYDAASATMGSEGYGGDRGDYDGDRGGYVEREIIREVAAENDHAQPEAPGADQQEAEPFFAGPEYRDQDDMLMEGTVAPREVPDSGDRSWRDEADFGPAAEGQPSFADDADVRSAYDDPDHEMRARIDQDDLTEALRRAREEENYLRQSDHGAPLAEPRETTPTEPYSANPAEHGSEPPVRPTGQPEAPQEHPVEADTRESTDTVRGGNESDEVQEYRQTRRRRISRFFSPRDNMGDNETE